MCDKEMYMCLTRLKEPTNTSHPIRTNVTTRYGAATSSRLLKIIRLF